MDQWIGFAGKITGKLAGVYSQRQRGSYTTIGEQSAINPLQVPFNQFLHELSLQLYQKTGDTEPQVMTWNAPVPKKNHSNS